MKNLHVIYIITKLELGGAQKVCLTLFNNLTSNDITTSIISGKEGKLVPEVEHENNVHLLPTLTREISFAGIKNEIQSFISLVRLLKKIKKQHAHCVVHTHSTKAGLVGRWAAFFAGIKTRIHTVHGYGFHEHQSHLTWWPTYILELFTSFITTHFVCVSSKDVEKGIQLFPRFSKKHSIIRAAVDMDRFIPAHYDHALEPSSEATFIFGTVACFKPQKNLFDLLQAFKLVHTHNPKTRLEIIGDGILRPAIESWIAQHNMMDAITLHGWQQQVMPFMLNWHAFVLSSLWEGLPCAIIEARLLMLPVVSYDTGGIHDVIVHGKNGFLCEQKKWQELAHHMLSISTNKKLYHQLHDFKEDLSDFSPATMIDKHAQLYKKYF